MVAERLRLLLVEDVDADARLIEEALAEVKGAVIRLDRAERLAEAVRRLEAERYDAILLDLDLPDRKGLAVLAAVATVSHETPILVLAGQDEELLALKAVRAGAHDYIVKGQVFGTMLARTIRHAIEHQRTERKLREAEERFRFQADLLDAVGEAVVATRPDGTIVYWNAAAERLYGWRADEVEGRDVLDLVATPETAKILKRVLGTIARGGSWAGEAALARRDGGTFPAFVTGTPVRDRTGQVIGVVGASTDLTAVKRLEQQLHQAQRMEAIGRLAGGVAHDFNNILTGIKGYAELLLEELDPSDPLRADAVEISSAADRAAGLTRQLLAFSRKQVLQPSVLDLAAVVGGMERMLDRLIGEDVELVFSCEPGLGRVRADRGQIEQLILNLAVNARDAMPRGGRLTAELRNVDLAAGRPGGAAGAGPYVLLRVADTGSGIPAAVLPHIFEPFFTTKEKGRGTGLGLATVYGIVTQSGGHVEVRSEPGRGTTFDVYLPRVDVEADEPATSPADDAAVRGETILLAEDEDAVRALAARTLRRLGYTVLEARDGAEAQLLFERTPGPIDLLLTDVVMPRMSGPELAVRLTRLRPGLRVLYMSGYTDDLIARHGAIEDPRSLLEKPFPPAVLAARVREMLDRPGRE